MKLLLISGSPRKEGNTSHILKKITEEISKTGTAEICYVTDYCINGCIGCNFCQSVLDKPGCVQNDEAQILLEKIMSADAVIYGTPLYGHSYSGQLKILMDRHVSLFKFVGGSDKAVGEMKILSFIKDKPVGLIVSCQGPEEDNTELVKMQFDKFCESSLANCFGKYVFPWCSLNAESADLSDATIHQILSDINALKLPLARNN
ncbi:MAG: flavodoxin family protein [Oscillospiraceae bacterium]